MSKSQLRSKTIDRLWHGAPLGLLILVAAPFLNSNLLVYILYLVCCLIFPLVMGYTTDEEIPTIGLLVPSAIASFLVPVVFPCLGGGYCVPLDLSSWLVTGTLLSAIGLFVVDPIGYRIGRLATRLTNVQQ